MKMKGGLNMALTKKMSKRLVVEAYACGSGQCGNNQTVKANNQSGKDRNNPNLPKGCGGK